MATIVGTLENELLNGSLDSDDIMGLGGNDTVRGFDQDDFINGNQGSDEIRGEGGEDTLRGGQGDDVLLGGSENDEVFGDLGDDSAWGNEGNDTIFGGLGSDLLYGNQGNDEINGNQGDDIIYGGQDGDTLRGGTGDDFISGDLGSDLIYGDQGRNTLAGGQGSDLFVLQQKFAGADADEANIIQDFTNDEDLIALEPEITFEDLNISQGVGEFAEDTVIRDANTGVFYAVLRGVISGQITSRDFTSNFTPPEPQQQQEEENNPNNDPPSFVFSQSTYTFTEGSGGLLEIAVLRQGNTDSIATVDYFTTNITAKEGSDYDRTGGSLTFDPGDTRKTFFISMRDDLIYENLESFDLGLNLPSSGASLGATSSAIVFINDNETASEGRFPQANFQASEADGSITITFNLNVVSDLQIQVDYTTGGGTATPGEDFTAQSGMVEFIPGQTTGTFTVPIINDSVSGEGNETVELLLRNPTTGVTVSSATLTIADDDGAAAPQASPRFANLGANNLGANFDANNLDANNLDALTNFNGEPQASALNTVAEEIFPASPSSSSPVAGDIVNLPGTENPLEFGALSSGTELLAISGQPSAVGF